MLLKIHIGYDLKTGEKIYFDPRNMNTHVHLYGATGTGKTVAGQVLLRRLAQEPTRKAAMYVFDLFGNLSGDLLNWMSDTTACPQHVRDRLLYIRFADAEHVLPFNPLRHDRPETRYYQLIRALDVLLRAWTNQDLQVQARLFQWMYKAMKACTELHMPIAISKFLIHPEFDEHHALISRLPRDIQNEWSELLRVRGSEPTRILESTRNRLHPFFESRVLGNIFSMWDSRLRIDEWIRDRRIVIFDLGDYGVLTPTDQSTIAGMLLNELIVTASRMSVMHGKQAVDPTIAFLDEFQYYVNPDVAEAIPTVRQFGLQLMLAHQSFSQLEKGDIDLTNMVWQARSRFVFANAGFDADIVADEIAKRQFDDMQVKHVETSLKQLITGHRKVVTESWGDTSTNSNANYRAVNLGYSHPLGDSSDITMNDGRSHGQTLANSAGTSHGRNESFLPEHETIEEKRKTFLTFDEFRLRIAKALRRQQCGECSLMTALQPDPRSIKIHWEPTPASASIERRKLELLQRNFESDVFVSAQIIEQQYERMRQELLSGPVIRLRAGSSEITTRAVNKESASPSLFRDS